MAFFELVFAVEFTDVTLHCTFLPIVTSSLALGLLARLNIKQVR